MRRGPECPGLCLTSRLLTSSAPGLVSSDAGKEGQQLKSDHLEPSLPYVAGEGDLSDFLVLNVQGEFV